MYLLGCSSIWPVYIVLGYICIYSHCYACVTKQAACYEYWLLASLFPFHAHFALSGSVGKNLANKPNVYVSSSAGARWREVQYNLVLLSYSLYLPNITPLTEPNVNGFRLWLVLISTPGGTTVASWWLFPKAVPPKHLSESLLTVFIIVIITFMLLCPCTPINIHLYAHKRSNR